MTNSVSFPAKVTFEQETNKVGAFKMPQGCQPFNKLIFRFKNSIWKVDNL